MRRAQDVSAIRDVPDSQELWLDEASDVSLIVEFVEHMPHLAARAPERLLGGACCASAQVHRCACAMQDEGSAQFFWSDVASLNSCAEAVRRSRARRAGSDPRLTYC
jgi:hypothetical protein